MERRFIPLISKMTLARILMLSAPVFFLASSIAMVQRQEPFYTWFYSFAWWSHILFIESFLFSRGHATLLFNNPARFLLLLPLSVTIWLIFEVFNFRMQNWHYLHLPSSRGLRWLGYTMAYATVLPALFATKNLLDFLGLFRETRNIFEGVVRFKDHFVVIGMAMLALPLLFPRIFFPFVWLGFVFLLEPLNYRSRAGSLLRDFEEGSSRNLYLLLMSGLICGVLWECWNFWAGSKWVYSLSYLEFLRLFEMPIFGFLGFPPFAVECYVMANTCFLLIDRIHQRCDSRTGALILICVGTVVVAFDALCYLGIDARTVISFNNAAW
jgi:hypothetical protein